MRNPIPTARQQQRFAASEFWQLIALPSVGFSASNVLNQTQWRNRCFQSLRALKLSLARRFIIG